MRQGKGLKVGFSRRLNRRQTKFFFWLVRPVGIPANTTGQAVMGAGCGEREDASPTAENKEGPGVQTGTAQLPSPSAPLPPKRKDYRNREAWQ